MRPGRIMWKDSPLSSGAPFARVALSSPRIEFQRTSIHFLIVIRRFETNIQQPRFYSGSSGGGSEEDAEELWES